MWQMGTFPTVSACEEMRPLAASLHLKGGRSGPDGRLAEASSLREASWPVLPVLHKMLTDGRIESICLNPSHGARSGDYDIWQVALDDLAFLREHFPTLGAARSR
jgi:hypothetical protein